MGEKILFTGIDEIYPAGIRLKPSTLGTYWNLRAEKRRFLINGEGSNTFMREVIASCCLRTGVKADLAFVESSIVIVSTSYFWNLKKLYSDFSLRA